MSKYNEGDLVTIKLTKADANEMNRDKRFYFYSKHVVEHKPAPFDWSTVKPGMAFKYRTLIFWYACGGIDNDFAPFIFSESNSGDGPYKHIGTAFLERAPEYDIEVGK